ncbi:MAG: hypothetical protein K2W95_22180 [Candidatus Obscuribacterales bacterium]|nr:hypothetical protein [Candidatus Obscuribacterales bacterium]
MQSKGGIVVNNFLILGLPDTATEADIKAACTRLTEKLEPAKFSDPAAKRQAEHCLKKVTAAGDQLKDAASISAHAKEVTDLGDQYKPEQLKPFIGHLCVAASIINYQDLMEAITKQTDIDLPLGQILQERRLLSQTELEGMLMGQKLYGAPNKPLDQKSRRLIDLGLVTIDMVKIALIDQRTSELELDQLIVKRGWIDQSVIEALS